MNSNNKNGKIVSFQEVAKVKIKNNLIIYYFSVESPQKDKTDEAYESILETVERIKKLLKGMDNIDNLKINFNTNSIHDYKNNKIKGYKAVASINFEIKIDDSKLLSISKLQSTIINFSSDDATVKLNSMNFAISDERKKGCENYAIQKAIKHGKEKADLIVKSAYDNASYEIAELNVDTSSSKFNIPRPYAMAKSASLKEEVPKDVISQGKSQVVATITMKLRIL